MERSVFFKFWDNIKPGEGEVSEIGNLCGHHLCVAPNLNLATWSCYPILGHNTTKMLALGVTHPNCATGFER